MEHEKHLALQGEMKFEIALKPEAVKVLEERWSNVSPAEGTELCICSWCGKMIGRDRDDPMIDWEDHIEYCGGCEFCEIAVRMWQPDPKQADESFELRFHTKCLNEIIVDRGRGTR
jgi:hypothetical protein